VVAEEPHNSYRHLPRLMGAGYWALLKTPIDAIPDLSDNQIIVF
jgi:Cu/Ag efflux pump CusA